MFPDVMILERASLEQPLLQDNQYDGGFSLPLVLTPGDRPVKPYRNSLEASCQMIDTLTGAFPACRDTVQLYKQLYDSGLQ